MKDKIRQGDLLFIPKTVSGYDTRPEIKRKDGIIREGEATGHHHRLETLESADVFGPVSGQPIIVVGKAGATVVHPEHKPVNLKPNTTYQVHVAREFDIVDGERYVAD